MQELYHTAANSRSRERNRHPTEILTLIRRASIATIIRIPYVHTLGNEQDFLYATTDVAIWSCSETGLAITAACGAVLRPLFREILASSRTVGSRAMSRGKDYSGMFGSEVEKRVSVVRNSRRRNSLDDGTGDEVPLQPLDQRGGGGTYKSDYNVGISTKAWHPDEEDRGDYLGRGPSDVKSVATSTRNVMSK
jgi:hypothetical protein